MKRFLFLFMLVNSCIVYGQDIPKKLILSSKEFSENQNLYPIYRVDLIVFSHQQVKEGDKQEQFPRLEKFIYSPDLLKLVDSPNLLVRKEAIEEGLTPGTQVIQSIVLNKNQNLVEVKKLESIGRDSNSDNKLLSLIHI